MLDPGWASEWAVAPASESQVDVINIYRQTLGAGPGAGGPARPADIGPDARRL